MPSGFCFAHDPERRSEHKAGATLGGIRSGAMKRKGLDPDQLGPLKSAVDAKRWSELIGTSVLTGTLSVAQGRVGLDFLDTWLKAYEAGELEERLAAWEAAQRGGH